MTATTDPAHAQVYGGWRKARGAEFLGGTPATMTLSVTLLVAIVAMQVSVRLFVFVILGGAVAFTATAVRIGDATAAGHLYRRWQFTAAKRRGWLRFHATSGNPDAWDKPGALAKTTMVDVIDETGTRWGMLRSRRGRLAATLNLAATTTYLHEPETTEGWVAYWHEALAKLGMMPGIEWLKVTIESTPATETGLQDSLLSAIDPKAPAGCQALLRELAQISPQDSPHVATWATAAFDPSKSDVAKKLSRDAQALHFTRLLSGIEADVERCGVTVLGAATAPEMSAVVHAAFDPSLREDLERGLHGDYGDPFETLRWSDAGPMSADAENWGWYEHDGHYSVSFGWRGAPRQQVLSNVLDALAEPGPFPRRLSVIYRPMPADKAAKFLDQQVNSARYRQASARTLKKREPNHREQVDLGHAEQAAWEEAARGAGVVSVSLYVTTTVSDPNDLDAAVADVHRRAPARITLRRLDGAHDVGFLTTLPVGVHPYFLKKEKHS